MLYTKS